MVTLLVILLYKLEGIRSNMYDLDLKITQGHEIGLDIDHFFLLLLHIYLQLLQLYFNLEESIYVQTRRNEGTFLGAIRGEVQEGNEVGRQA